MNELVQRVVQFDRYQRAYRALRTANDIMINGPSHAQLGARRKAVYARDDLPMRRDEHEHEVVFQLLRDPMQPGRPAMFHAGSIHTVLWQDLAYRGTAHGDVPVTIEDAGARVRVRLREDAA